MLSICNRAVEQGVDLKMYLYSDEIARQSLDEPFITFFNWLECDEWAGVLEKDDVVVIDSYHVDLDTLKEIKLNSGTMIVVDDNMRLPYEDMCVLNPNYFAAYVDYYPDNAGNTYYLGKDYTLLRDAFIRPVDRTVKEAVTDVLITMGGTDLTGMTSKVISFFNSLNRDGVSLHVVVTNAYKDIDTIRSMLKPQDKCYVGIDAAQMSSLMEKCDFAVASAGGTSNELIRMQCPSILVTVADNQANNVRLMSSRGFFDTFDASDIDAVYTMFDYGKRKIMTDKLKTLYSEKTAADLVMNYVRNE